jgi:hypothetical protein
MPGAEGDVSISEYFVVTYRCKSLAPAIVWLRGITKGGTVGGHVRIITTGRIAGARRLAAH